MTVTLVTGTNLTGIEMVTVSNGLRTMVTFSGVRREADGRKLVCVAVFSSGVISKPATLTIQCYGGKLVCVAVYMLSWNHSLLCSRDLVLFKFQDLHIAMNCLLK